MNNEPTIKETLSNLQESEGSDFRFYELAISDEVSKRKEIGDNLAIKIITVLGVFLATLAFLGFLLISGLYKSEIGLMVTGLIFIVSGVVLTKVYNQLTIDTLSVTIFVIGFLLFGYGLTSKEVAVDAVCLIFAVCAVFSISVTQNYILTFVSVLILFGSLMGIVLNHELYNLIHLYVAAMTLLLTLFSLHESKIITASKSFVRLYNPVRIGLIFSLIAGLAMVGVRGLLALSPEYIWLSSIATILAVLYTSSFVLETLGVKENAQKIPIYAAVGILLIPTALSPAISGALVIVLLSFLTNHKTGLAVGIVAFIYFLSQYYYDLNFTLLEKSVILFLSGIMFLLFYLFIHKKLEHEDVKTETENTPETGKSAPHFGWTSLASIAVFLNLIAVLVYFNYSVYQKEKVISDGKFILLELAPVDPRSLMQGDYMDLRYAIAQDFNTETELEPTKGFFVVKLDSSGVAQKIRIQSNEYPLSSDEILLTYTRVQYQKNIGAESYFFQEGQSEKYEKAKYGGLRADNHGNCILIGLYDSNKNKIE